MKKTLILSSFLAFGACGTPAETESTTSVSLGLENLESLGTDYEYEGWIIVDDAPVSTGRFDVNAEGNPEPASFDVNSDMLEKASKFVISIEAKDDPDPKPSSTKVLGGDLGDDGATLSVVDGASFGDDFTSATGAFVLTTPTTPTEAGDETYGIWYLTVDSTTADKLPGLSLPTLPAGWVYEGWVVKDGNPVSTGRFSAVDAADSDNAGDTAGKDENDMLLSGPEFPGQDFIDPMRDLSNGYAAVISVEPEPDDSDKPFAFKPLVQMSISGDIAPTAQSMSNMASTAPGGTVSF